jgi:hypothetical protein
MTHSSGMRALISWIFRKSGASRNSQRSCRSAASDARIGGVGLALRRRRGGAHLPVQRNAVGLVLCLQAVQEGRSAPRQPGDEERSPDLLCGDVGMTLAIPLDPEPVHQHASEILACRQPSDEAQSCLALERLHQPVERVLKGRLAEVAQARAAARNREQVSGVEPDPLPAGSIEDTRAA